MSTLQFDEIKRRQRAQWDASAPGWKKWERNFIQNLQPLTDLMVRNAGIKPGYSVLDLACGTGEPALTIAKIVGPSGKVVGLDIAPGMIAVAKERIGPPTPQERHIPAERTRRSASIAGSKFRRCHLSIGLDVHA
jgi:SAM-dependent methyltransferase